MNVSLAVCSYVNRHIYQLTAYYWTPPTKTRLNCRVESRRRCVRNSQLVGDSFDETEHICRQRSPQSSPSLQFPVLLRQSQFARLLRLVISDDIITPTGLYDLKATWLDLCDLTSNFCYFWLFDFLNVFLAFIASMSIGIVYVMLVLENGLAYITG